MNVLSRVVLTSALTISCLAISRSPPGPAGRRRLRSAGAPAVAIPYDRPADGPWAAKRRELESVLGREVRTLVEEGVGRIIDLLADRNGQVRAAVIEFGGFMGIGTRKIAVEWSALRFEGDGKQPQVIVDMTRDQLRKAPEYKPNEPAVVRKAQRVGAEVGRRTLPSEKR